MLILPFDMEREFTALAVLKGTPFEPEDMEHEYQKQVHEALATSCLYLGLLQLIGVVPIFVMHFRFAREAPSVLVISLLQGLFFCDVCYVDLVCYDMVQERNSRRTARAVVDNWDMP